jgi:hypothetical protein
VTNPQTSAGRLETELATLPPEIPRYVAEEYLLDALRALRDYVERTNG